MQRSKGRVFWAEGTADATAWRWGRVGLMAVKRSQKARAAGVE